MNFIKQYLQETKEIINSLNIYEINKIVNYIIKIKKKSGRIFFLGLGGSAANASHAVNDFRKLVGIECYTPTDNVSEFSARVNDDGWQSVFKEWLKVSKLDNKDLVFVLSVGGGNLKKNVSPNIVEALKYAKLKKSIICGIVGKNNGYTKKIADACLVIPVKNIKNLTPHTESFQTIIWHLIVSHPKVKVFNTKW
jgi:D-sedoheptulose 7-phosphate isomerase